MKALLYFTGACLLFCIAACNSNETASSSANGNDGASLINADTLAKKIAFFSTDSFQGRRPFTLGETRAVDYIQSQFKTLDLEPGNGNGYVQNVPMVEIKPAVPPVLKMTGTKGEMAFKNMTDYVIWTKQTDTPVIINNADVVFAGFGVVAPENNWNDYAGIDVKGKIVLVMVNDPGFTIGDTTMFKGKEMTYYGRWTYKYEEAARQGAKGCLIIHNTAAASYPFNVVQNSNGGTKLHLDNRNNKTYTSPLMGWVSADAAKKILEASGKDTSIYVKANQRGFKAEPLSIQLSANIKVNAVFNTSHNVLAKITGTKYPDEYVIYTAHWDHLGIGAPDEKGDSIYNGALDNASGVISILEIAKAFQSLKEKPERTIVFLAVTAEEQGLLGSEYYAKNPVYPLAKTVANINIDGIDIIGKTKDLGISGGKGQSELEDMLEAELKKNGRYISPELHPEAGHYFRSDHFNFAKVGVPSITISAGLDHEAKGKEYGKQREEEYTEKYYHRPADEYNAATWDLTGAVADLQLLFTLGKQLAYGHEWPKWHNGSEFKAVREK